MSRLICRVMILLELFLQFSIHAQVTVKNLRIQQRYPWNGLVDIFYGLSGSGQSTDDSSMEIRLTFSGYDGDLDQVMELKTLSGDGVKGNLYPGDGYHTVWNMARDYPDFHSSAFTVRIKAEKLPPRQKDGMYLVIHLDKYDQNGKFFWEYTDREPDVTQDVCRTGELWLRKITGGTFMMGSPAGEIGRWGDEAMHPVTLTDDFHMGIFEITQYQWKKVMGSNPSAYSGDDRPVESVSYDSIRGVGEKAGAGWPSAGHAVDQESFLGRLRAKTGLMLDLPTEAQWEYACRAGCSSSLNSGQELTSSWDDCKFLGELGRYNGNTWDGHGIYHEHTRVGSYLPNQWGLYDMHGNIAEWCLDWYYFGLGTKPVKDPKGAQEGRNRVMRSGSWNYQPSVCRCAARSNTSSFASENTHGLRLVCLPEGRQ